MIKIDNANEFERLFNDTFGDIDRNTLSKLGAEKLRIDLGGDEEGAQRLNQALDRSSKVLQYCFKNKAVWLRMILWSDREERNLENAGFKLHKAIRVFKQKSEDQILYTHFNRYSKHLLTPIRKSIINFDMAVEPSANITCYFVSFSAKLIINIYDDRGLDIYTPNNVLLNKIKNDFFEWLI